MNKHFPASIQAHLEDLLLKIEDAFRRPEESVRRPVFWGDENSVEEKYIESERGMVRRGVERIRCKQPKKACLLGIRMLFHDKRAL
jgi:hypothetical protein